MPKFLLSRLALAAAAAFALPSHAAVEGFYRQPALQGDQLVFVAEGDLWRVGSQGGAAQRLTTHPGYETTPALSVDGQWLAFTGQYDGASTDVYVMPVSGGVPKRLSWSGGTKVWGFISTGEVLYTGPTVSGQPGTQLFLVDPKTAQSRALPVAQASDGALSADGKTLYFTREGARGDNLRQYHGGGISRLWVLDLAGNAEARPLLPEGNNDRRPMPYVDHAGKTRIAFLSDRDGTVNVWSVDASGQDLHQHTHQKAWDLRQASISGSQIAYSLGADVHMLELNNDKDQRLAITLDGDFDQQRERFIKKPQDFLTHLALAPNGEQVLLTSRGHLATQGAGALRRAELPLPADGRCRGGEFSSDGKSVFALCDFSGEVEIWRFAANGLDQPVQITHGATTLRLTLKPSPDGRHIAHTDKDGHLYLTDLQAKDAKGAAASPTTRVIDSYKRGDGFGDITWSPDGTSLAYVRATRVDERAQLFLYTLAGGKLTQLSSERYDSSSPSFTPDGKWLYFVSDRSFSASGGASPWGDRNMGAYFDRRAHIYALALQPGLRFPFAAKDELQEEAKDGDKKDADKQGKDADKKDKSAKLPAIQLEGLAQRLYEVPQPPGNTSALSTDGKHLWWLEDESTLKALKIGNDGDKPDTVSGGVRQYAVSADGKKLMVARGEHGSEILLVDAAPKLPGETDNFAVRWSDWQIDTDPKAEWREMFADAWRMHRDWLYDKAMRGVDWQAVRTKYAPLVERVTDRAELDDLLGQMTAEVSTLHSQVRTLDVRSGAADPALAGLGAELERTAAGWRIARLYQGDAELPEEAGPLAAPGLGIQAGDVITQVNGRATAGLANIAELLRGQAGHQVLLQIKRGAGPTSGAPFSRIVTPVAQSREASLRYRDWEATRGAKVEQAGAGRIGYLHIRAMGKADIDAFARDFYAQIDREGLIVDVRFNNGGNIDSWILEKLLRRVWENWQPRSPEGAAPVTNMQQTFRGPIVVLANEDTYSDGETFTEGFKRLGIGTVIGKTTSGAGVWLGDGNRLLDNGIARAAEMEQFAPNGQMLVEGVGVKPDVEVDNPPRATYLGSDAQLDAAVALIKKRLAEQPRVEPKPDPIAPVSTKP